MTTPAGPVVDRPYAPPARPTNVMAILSIITAFLAPPAGLFLGIFALKQIATTGEEGSSLAWAGAIIGGIFTGLIALFLMAWLSMFLSIIGTALSIFSR